MIEKPSARVEYLFNFHEWYDLEWCWVKGHELKNLELLAANVTTATVTMIWTGQGASQGAELIEEHTPNINPNVVVGQPLSDGEGGGAGPNIAVVPPPPDGVGDGELNLYINPNINILQLPLPSINELPLVQVTNESNDNGFKSDDDKSGGEE